jgi:hypothetical protein
LSVDAKNKIKNNLDISSSDETNLNTTINTSTDSLSIINDNKTKPTSYTKNNDQLFQINQVESLIFESTLKFEILNQKKELEEKVN